MAIEQNGMKFGTVLKVDHKGGTFDLIVLKVHALKVILGAYSKIVSKLTVIPFRYQIMCENRTLKF